MKYKMMKAITNSLLVSMLIITLGNLNAAASEFYSNDSGKAKKTLAEAAIVFDHILEDAENGIPQNLINSAGGIVILPGACRVAAGAFNGSGGTGIAMIRNENGSWSFPFFVIIREGNLGNKIDALATDIVLFFKDSFDVKSIERTEIALGDDVSVAAGPGKNGIPSGTNLTFGAEVYSYQRREGAFSGVCIKGGILSNYAILSNSLYGIEAPSNEEVYDLRKALTIHGE
jgi:lipid-binding SYLF domain-containing protein